MKKYTVIAYDTDYGVEAFWEFEDKTAADQWAAALNFDYGNGSAIVV